MSRKKSASSKAEFIRSISLTVPVDDVLKKAEDQGIKLTKGYVQTTRSGMRNEAKAAEKTAAPAIAKTGAALTMEATFVRDAYYMGLKKARHLLDTELQAVDERVLKVVNGS